MVARADILAGRAVILIDIQDTIEKQLRGIRSKMRMFTNSISDIGGDLFRGGIAGTLASAFPVKEFMTFQDQMLFLQTKVQATDEAIKPLEKTIRNLGMTTSFSSQEVAKAGTMFAQAGFSTIEIQKSLQAALDLARGSQVDLTTSTTILSNAIRTFQVDASMAAVFASKFTTAARLGTLDIVDLGESLKYSAGTFANFGLELDDVLGMITTLANSGLKASLAGTSLNTAFLNLASSAPKLKELLDVELLEADFKNPIQALRKLEAGLSKFSKIEQAGILQDLVNIRGGRAIQGLLLQGLDKLEANIAQIKLSTDEARKSAMKLDSALGGVWRRGVSAFQELSIAIGQTSEGPLTKFGENVAAVLNDLSRLSVTNQGLVQTLLLIGPASLAAGVGILGLTMVLGKLAMFLTPIMMLNQALFSMGAWIVGVNLSAINTLSNLAKMSAINIVGKVDSKFLGSMETYRSNLSKLARTESMLKFTQKNKLTATQQINQKKLIDLDRRFAGEQAALAARVQKQEDAAFALRVDKNEKASAELIDLRRKTTRSLGDDLRASTKLSELNVKLGDLQTRRVAIEKANQTELTRIIREQFKKRWDVFSQNGKIVAAVEPKLAMQQSKLNAKIQDQLGKKELALNTKLAESKKNLTVLDSRRARVTKSVQFELTRLLKDQGAERAQLILESNAKLKAMQDAIPAERQASITGIGGSAKERAEIIKHNLFVKKQQEELIATSLKFNAQQAALQEKQAKALANLRSRQFSVMAKLAEREALLEKQKAGLLTRLEKLRLAASQNMAKLDETFMNRRVAKEAALRKRFAAQELALESTQAKQLMKVRAQQTASLSPLQKSELAIRRQQIATIKEVKTARAANLQAQIALEEKFRKQGASLPGDATSPAQNRLYAKQANERRKLIERSALQEASIVKKGRSKMASILKARNELAPPDDMSSFLTKERGPKLGAGIVSAFTDIFRSVRMLFSFNFKSLFKDFDVVRTLASGFKLLFTAAKGVLTVMNGIRRVVFSLSGWLMIAEFLLLFGDKIPVIKDMLAGLGTAFSNAFGNIGETLRNLGPSVELIGRGFSKLFGGDAAKGLEQIKLAFIDITNTLRTGLYFAWKQFLDDIEPGAQIIKSVFSGLLATAEALGAAISGIFGTAMKGGEIIIKGDGTLLEALKSAFSKENIKTFFAGIIGAIESIGLGLISAVGFIGNVLIQIRLVFMGILRSLTRLPGLGSDAQDAMDELNEPTGPNADEIKLLRKRKENLENSLNSFFENTFDYDPKTRAEFLKQLAEVNAQLFALGDTGTSSLIPVIDVAAEQAELKRKIKELFDRLSGAIDGAAPTKEAQAAADQAAATANTRATASSIMEDTLPGIKGVAGFIGEALSNLRFGDIPKDVLEDAADGSLSSLSNEDIIKKFATKTESGRKLIEKIGKEIDTNNPLQWLLDSGYFFADEDIAGLSPEELIKKSKQRQYAEGILGEPDLLNWGSELASAEETDLKSLFNKVKGMSLEDVKSEAFGLWSGFKSAFGAKAQEVVAPQADQVARMVGPIGKAIVGDFQSTRGNMLQMVPRMEKLQEKANEHLEGIDEGLATLNGNKNPFVFTA